MSKLLGAKSLNYSTRYRLEYGRNTREITRKKTKSTTKILNFFGVDTQKW